MRYNYKTYDEIPDYMVDYLLSVIGEARNIVEVPLRDINSFLNGLEEWSSDSSDNLYPMYTEEDFVSHKVH
jgi:hypothetical protein